MGGERGRKRKYVLFYVTEFAVNGNEKRALFREEQD